MKIVRVTTLESFRRFRDNVTGTYDTEERLIEHLTGKFEGNVKTEIGSEFHKLIETGLPSSNSVKIFSNSQIIKAVNHRDAVSPFISEVRNYKKYGKIVVTGAVDVLQGSIIRDTKVKFKPVLMSEYENSYQWRFYLDIFEINTFVYDVFEVIGFDEAMGANLHNCEMKQHEPFYCYKYENMQKDLQTLVDEFVEWVNFRKLSKYLENY